MEILNDLPRLAGAFALTVGLALGTVPAVAQDATDDKRIAEEEASFMKLLAEQREADKAAAKRKAEAKKAAAAAAERKRVEEEEASFMRTLAAQREADKAAAKRKAEAKKAAAAEAERKRQAAEAAAERKRKAAEAAAERERLAAKAAAEYNRLLAERRAALAAAAERKRVEAEEASFMRTLAAQREADKAAAKRKAEAKRLAREKAARSCQNRIKQASASGTIQFGLSSAKLSGGAGTALLDKLAAAVSDCEGDLSITVEGHTDSAGSRAFNDRLSQNRAQTVADYLISKGVAANRITAKGFGPSKPVASNATRAGRQKNRRIEFTVQ